MEGARIQVKTEVFKGRDFISELEYTKEELETILDVAFQLKRDYAMKRPHRLLEGKSMFLIFYNRSLRTRNSFEAGFAQLGGHANYLDSDKVYTPAIAGMEKAYTTERVSDVARVLSRYGDAIAIRIYGKYTGWVYGRGNEYIREFARWADIPVINMEDDVYHPCQAMADIMTMKEKLHDLRGKKVVVSWAYSPSVEKPVAVPQSAIGITSFFGADIVLAHPEGFELDPNIIAKVKENQKKYGGTFEIVHDMKKAFKDADVVYPKCWGVLKHIPPQAKEADWDAIQKLFDANKHWICDEGMMKLAKPDALYMHCLPADRGFEVTDEVIDGPNSVVFDEAENRLHAQKAVMALTMQ